MPGEVPAPQLLEEIGLDLRQLQLLDQRLLLFRQFQGRKPQHLGLDKFDQFLGRFDVTETLEESPVIAVEMGLTLDQDGPRQVIEPDQRAIRQILG